MRLIVLTLLLMLLVACGQKGLLYIPEPSSADSAPESEGKKPAPQGDSTTEEDK